MPTKILYSFSFMFIYKHPYIHTWCCRHEPTEECQDPACSREKLSLADLRFTEITTQNTSNKQCLGTRVREHLQEKSIFLHFALSKRVLRQKTKRTPETSAHTPFCISFRILWHKLMLVIYWVERYSESTGHKKVLRQADLGHIQLFWKNNFTNVWYSS